MRWVIERRPVIGVAIALIIVIGSGVNAYKNYLDLKGIEREEERGHQIKDILAEIGLLLLQSESSQRGYLLSRKPGYLKRYQLPIVTISLDFKKLDDLIANPKQKLLLSRTQGLILEKLAELDKTIRVAQDLGISSAIAIVRTDAGEKIMDQILDNLQQLSGSEDILQQNRSLALQAQSRNTADTFAVTIFLGAISILWALSLINKAIDKQSESARIQQVKLESLIEERTAALKSELKTQRLANEAKSEFIEFLSHELRTPLSVILGWTKLLSQISPQDFREKIEIIERNAKALLHFVDDLLDLSRMAKNKISLERRPLDLNELVEVAVRSQRIFAQSRNIALQIILDPINSPISGDRDRLEQVVVNLLSNAIKFTSRSGKVNVTTKRTENAAQIIVNDSGLGISPDFLPHIFDQFSQADKSNGGLGLGLAISQQLVALHGGTILAQSPGEGLGATFTVTLPASLTYKAPSPKEITLKKEPIRSSSSLSGLNLLVVDDYDDSRSVVSLMLTMSGANVVGANSAREALAQIEKLIPDVLIADIGMAVEDGYDLIRKVRSLPPEKGGRIPAIAFTAYTSEEDKSRALAEGFQMHLPKPLEDAEQLIVAVRNLAGRGRF